MKKTFCISSTILFLFIIILESQAQISDSDLVSKFIDVKAPNPASLIDNSVILQNDLYTKTKLINIPIYTFKSKEIQIPVSISTKYPNRAEIQGQSEVGLGWNLQAGGKISRSVHGKADESVNGYFESYTKIENAANLSKGDFDNGMKNNWDTSPDEFYFSFNGIQGRFMFDNFKNIHVDSDRNVKIVPTFSNDNREILSFIIIDDNGFTYHFGNQDNAIEKTASKVDSETTNRLKSDMLVMASPNTNSTKVFNFVPDASFTFHADGSHGLPGPAITVGINNIIDVNNVTLPDGAFFALLGSVNIFQQTYLFDTTNDPINTGWKLTKIESPNKTDFVDFEYDVGGWVEFEMDAESVSHNFRKADALLPVRVYGVSDLPPPSISVSGFFDILYPGQIYAGRPDDWTSNGDGSFSNMQFAPKVTNVMSPTVYKKISLLKKITNKYGEYLSFKHTNGSISGYSPHTSQVLGPLYNPQLLESISIFPDDDEYNNTIASFEIVNDLTKLTILGKNYNFNYDNDNLKITYPTGGYARYSLPNAESLKEELYSPEDGLLTKELVFSEEVNYSTPSHETKLVFTTPPANMPGYTGYGWINIYNSAGNFHELNSKGEHKVYRTVKSFTNGKLQSLHKLTTPVTNPDDENISYYRLTTDEVISSGYHSRPPSTRDFERGIEENTIVYSPQGDIAKQISTTDLDHEIVTSIKAVRLNDYNITPGETNVETRSYSYYYYYFPIKKTLESKSESIFNDGKLTKTSNSVVFDTDNYYRNNVIKTITTDSNNDEIIKKTKYPYSIANDVYYSPTLNSQGVAYDLMEARNIDNIPIEETVYKKKDGTSEELLLSSKVNVFQLDISGSYPNINPESVEIIEETTPINDYIPIDIYLSGTNFYLTKDSRLNTKVNYEEFDSEGNLLQSRVKNSIPTSYIWGYNNRFVIAKLVGIEYQDIINSIGSATINNLNNSVDENFINAQVQTIRESFADGLVTTYTYNPILGVTSITDPRGITVYHEYDIYHRLKQVKDLDKNILSDYYYYTKN